MNKLKFEILEDIVLFIIAIPIVIMTASFIIGLITYLYVTIKYVLNLIT